MAVVFWADRAQHHPGPMLEGDTSNSPKSPSLSSISNEPTSSSGGELPAIVKRYGGAQSSGKAVSKSETSSAPGLENLLTGLESKVKANPTNISNRILLAQTYLELGFKDKALKEARDVVAINPSLPRANLVLASVLSKSQQQAELNEALTLLDGLRSKTEVKQFLVQLYLGDASIRLSDHQGAINYWNAALKAMPETDNRRQELQKRIKDLGGNV